MRLDMIDPIDPTDWSNQTIRLINRISDIDPVGSARSTTISMHEQCSFKTGRFDRSIAEYRASEAQSKSNLAKNSQVVYFKYD